MKQRSAPEKRTAIDRARQLYDQRAWRAAFETLADADRDGLLEPAELELYAHCAYLIGKDADSAEILARAHHEFLKSGNAERAAYAAFWIGFPMMLAGESARGSGWLQRARRVLDDAACVECVVHGYLQMPVGLRAVSQGDFNAAHAAFSSALEIGERFKNADLVILARHAQGRALVGIGRVDDGIALFDEIMVAVTADEASPLIVGAVYCSVISACNDIFDFRRAQEWANVLHEWCASRPDLVPHRGECLVRHAELVRFHGGWSDAMDLVSQARTWLTHPASQRAAGAALYQQAELHRLRGEFAEAEESYREANGLGHRTQPGLALMRLAQGRVDDAAGSIRQAVAEVRGRPQRSIVLMAAIEILIAANDVAGARRASDELSRIAVELPAPFLRAAASHGLGAVRLAEGDARGAIEALRDACFAWSELEAPYEGARARHLMALAHRKLGDRDSASMELDASRSMFEKLGATADLARIAELASPAAKREDDLTDREVQVLRLVATGKTNRAIAATLGISEKTVARHVSNIFFKLDLSTRAAATAYMYQHDLAEAGPRRT